MTGLLAALSLFSGPLTGRKEREGGGKDGQTDKPSFQFGARESANPAQPTLPLSSGEGTGCCILHTHTTCGGCMNE